MIKRLNIEYKFTGQFLNIQSNIVKRLWYASERRWLNSHGFLVRAQAKPKVVGAPYATIVRGPELAYAKRV